MIPGARLIELLGVLQDYNNYSEIYKPAVVESRLVEQRDDVFRYRLKFVQKGFGIKTGLAGEFQTTYYRLSDATGYSITEATKLAELQNPSTAAEQELPVSASHGYVERVFTIVRYQESEKGVSVEMETLTLSRDVPAPIRWMIAPAIQRFSRQTITNTLESLRASVQRAHTFESASRK